MDLASKKICEKRFFLRKIVFFIKNKFQNDFFLEEKMANLCCYFRCQITPFPEHILQKMSIFWWEFRILSGLQVTYQISYVVIFLFLHAILEAGIILKKYTPLGPNYPPFLAAFQQKLKHFAGQKNYLLNFEVIFSKWVVVVNMDLDLSSCFYYPF